MHETRDKSKRKGHIATLALPSLWEARKAVRKVAVRAGQAHRDARNEYRRKPKFFGGWA